MTAFALELADPDCLDPAAASAALRGAPWRRFAVLGDSVAAGVRAPLAGYRDAGFTDRVASVLAAGRDGFAYENHALRDARLAEIIEHQLPAALDFAPDLALVVAGGNDALSRRFEPGRVRALFADLLGPLAAAGALVVTVGLFDLARSGLVPAEYAGALAERMDELDALTAASVEAVGGVHVDTHHHPRGSDPDIYAPDLIHANARGHAIAAAAVVRALADVTASPR
jgi:lysophospholipase L1-like esterase